MYINHTETKRKFPSCLNQRHLIPHILQQNNNLEPMLFNKFINVFLIGIIFRHKSHIELQDFSLFFMQLKIDILLGETESNCNDLSLLEIPSYNLFPVHYVCRMVKTDRCVCVISVLSNQVSSMTDTVTVHEIFLLYQGFVAQTNHDITRC